MTVVATPGTRQTAWGAKPKIRIRHVPPGGDTSPRPLTATLEHPAVLNVALLKKLDMTAFTKQGLIAISRLCAVPILARTTKQKQRRRVPALVNVENEDNSSSEVERKVTMETKPKKRGKRPTATKRENIDSIWGAAVPPPEPCRSCGRPEMPERLHSHPAAPAIRSAERPVAKPPARNPISKPVAANFKSTEKLRREQTVVEKEAAPTERPRSARPRGVTCYICLREFGTASFPLHEPKCILKFERENALLPPELQRKIPVKPASEPGLNEWNDQAWQAAQAALVPCPRCSRTFNPDRLVVHSRSCKGNSADPAVTPPRAPSTPSGRPPTLPCYICAREFGTRSIAIHEPQCLRKWRQENAALPQVLQRPEPRKPETDFSHITGCYICGVQIPHQDRPSHEQTCLRSWRKTNDARPEDQRLPEPQRPNYRFKENGDIDYTGTWHAIWSNHMESLIPCRQCGRKFFPDRIVRHEAACSNLPIKSKTSRQ